MVVGTSVPTDDEDRNGKTVMPDDAPNVFTAMEDGELRAKVPLTLKLIRPFWFAVIFLAGVISVYKGLLYLVIDGILIRLSPELNPPKPKELLDEAFQAIKARLEREGFTQVPRKRVLKRSKDGVEAIVDFGAGKYNETGVNAQFYIYLERTSSARPPNHINHDMIWISRVAETGQWKAQVDLGQLRLLPRVFGPNIAPRLRRKARTRRAISMIERHALPWFAARKR